MSQGIRQTATRSCWQQVPTIVRLQHSSGWLSSKWRRKRREWDHWSVIVNATDEGSKTAAGAAESQSHTELAHAALQKLSEFADDKASAGLAEATMQALLSNPETADQIKRYEAALARVQAAKAAAAELEEMFAKAGEEVAKAEAAEEASTRQRVDEVMAKANVNAAEKFLAAAELEAQQATLLKLQLSAQVTQTAERAETVKAGACACLGGLTSALPLVVASGQGGASALLTLLTALGSCFLFGATYRYAVRQDVDNVQLRSGVVASFGLVRAAAGGDVLQSASAYDPLDVEAVVGPAALYAGQSVVLFAFAAAVLEYGFRHGWVKRFGQKATAETIM